MAVVQVERPTLPQRKRVSIETTPLDKLSINNPSEFTIEAASIVLKGLIIHSVFQTQSNNWIFITQVEVYYHNKKIDDVSQVNKKKKNSEQLLVKLTEREEGRGSWHELCFWCYQCGIVVSGGLYNDGNKLGAFLGVTIPSFIGEDLYLILLSPSIPADTSSCVRVLRNYKRNASLNEWYVSVCSKLLYLEIYEETSEDEYAALEEELASFQYWEKSGFGR